METTIRHQAGVSCAKQTGKPSWRVNRRKSAVAGLSESIEYMNMVLRSLVLVVAAPLLFTSVAKGDVTGRLEKPEGTVRFATFNISHYRKRSGDLIKQLKGGKSQQTQKIAEIIQRVRPDVLLINEFDFDPDHAAAKHLVKFYLKVGQNGNQPIELPHMFSAPVNTGVDSGVDLNDDGKTGTPNDCFGYGAHPGQYGMLVLSKFEIDTDNVRTMQKFLWKDMPGALLPIDPSTGEAFYSEDVLDRFRLSSKSHWDIPIVINNHVVHFLTAHPTPPVFDGPEDRNGRRNHDEIRMLADYVDPARSEYLYDDSGRRGGLDAGARFVVAGDLNADPFDGDSVDSAIVQLLNHALIDSTVKPESTGAQEQAVAQGGANKMHRGDPKLDTADFGDAGRSSGNLRIDYVLPAKTLKTVNSGVFWPPSDQAEFKLISASDHRMVWIDVAIK